MMEERKKQEEEENGEEKECKEGMRGLGKWEEEMAPEA